ncbi:MAG: stage II sporulation protein M [Deinococcales bacterium]
MLLVLQITMASFAQAILAEQAVKEWLAKANDFNIFSAINEPDHFCKEVYYFGTLPELIRETKVNYADVTETTLEEGIIRYSYSAEAGQGVLGEVQVDLRSVDLPLEGSLEGSLSGSQPSGSLLSEGEAWQVERTRFVMQADSPELPAILHRSYSGYIFFALSLVLIYLLSQASFLRRYLIEAWQVIREHRRLVTLTSIMLYGALLMGVFAGLALPKDCMNLVRDTITGSLDSIGIVQLAESGDVSRLAAAILFWNFSMGAISTTLLPALLFGIPAYLLNMLRFLTLGIPFAEMLQPSLLLHLPVFVLELLAYILITAGGGMMLATLIKQGFGSYRLAVKKLFLMIPLAFVLLFIAAWYESIEILWLFPLMFGP